MDKRLRNEIILDVIVGSFLLIVLATPTIILMHVNKFMLFLWILFIIVFPLSVWLNVKAIKNQIRDEARNDKKI